MSSDSSDPKGPFSFPVPGSRPGPDFSVPRIREVVMDRRSDSRPRRSAPPRPHSRPTWPPPTARTPPPPPPPPRAPPSQEGIERLARIERVPLDVARVDLEGGVPCRQWREQNAEQAARFDRVYALVEASPGLTVDAAIALEQRGVSAASLATHQAEQDAKKRLLKARANVPNTAVEAFRQRLIDEAVDLVLALEGRVVTDRLVRVDRLALEFAELGSVPALDVIMLAPRQAWLSKCIQVSFEDRLVRSPAPVDVVPSRRPAADPTPFLAHVGRNVKLTLRNGMVLPFQLAAVGPFDLIVGEAPHQFLVPLHAIAAWEPAAGEK